MRLKENKDNWNASGLIRKLSIPPVEVKAKARKNTRKWCKGREGVPHDYDLANLEAYTFYPVGGCSVWLEYRCQGCQRKELVIQRYESNGELQA